MKVINPATEEIIATIVDDHVDSLEEKYQQLKSGQVLWAKKTLEERTKILIRFKELLKENISFLADILTTETGKPLQQAKNEINGAIARITWLTTNAEKYLSDEVMRVEGSLKEIISYEPLGVVANISAWNYPYLVGVNVFVPALLAGNAVFYKPSEFATNTGMQINRLLKEAGVPENTFKIAVGSGEVGKYLLSMDLNGYFFTGSYVTGKYIYQQVAPRMVPCQLELGGKDALYITEDIANIKAVAEATADGAFYNNGQSCCAVERIYVHEQVYDAYLEAFVNQVKTWKIGNPTEEGTYFGPITRGSHIRVLQEQIQDALEKGATLLLGGKAMERPGFYFEPTILTEVTHEMTLMREESFGPIIGIMRVKNDQEALKLMQDTAYGLTAGVYSDKQERAVAILKELNVGSGYWNCCDRVSAALPWSGRQHSGVGATLSHQGIRAFTKPKGWHLVER
ncbi:aldehyde dehydrogenase family protein [Olivibacter domesticus]|uniref:Acyl-CoA reductase n=1 Tax=Olivibacter domesticus TaxID=407022 RepID=A0A1H7TDL2_OLID1|nr:aldehyde dehydrogenase family protein [Olivibacter domesticus]SEL82635.1 Acyl-CoA reductase [Olivibacter domesticus]